jgi:hypothetical protein
MEGSLVAYKVFTNGSVLPASDVNTYLMDQSVMVFSSSATRAAAITAPVEGMLTWLEDTNTYQNYNGSAWVNLITPATSGLTKLAQQTFTAATSIIIDNVFSATYNAYELIMNFTSSTGTPEPGINYRVGGVNASTNYNHQITDSAGTALAAFRTTAGTSASLGRTAASGGILTATIYGPALAQPTYSVSQSFDSALTLRAHGTNHTTATAYDGFRISFASSTGQIRVYGLEN